MAIKHNISKWKLQIRNSYDWYFLKKQLFHLLYFYFLGFIICGKKKKHQKVILCFLHYCYINNTLYSLLFEVFKNCKPLTYIFLPSSGSCSYNRLQYKLIKLFLEANRRWICRRKLLVKNLNAIIGAKNLLQKYPWRWC